MNKCWGIEQVEDLVNRSEAIHHQMSTLEKEMGAMENYQDNRGAASVRTLHKLQQDLDALKLEINSVIHQIDVILGDDS